MKILVITAAVLIALMMPSSAMASLTLTTADHAAKIEADSTVTAWQDAYDPAELGATYIVNYALDPCELVGRHAECDVTYALNDGDSCDALIEVRLSRRHHVVVYGDDPVCDSDTN